MALTANKKKFAHGLILGMNNREAAIHAGYSEKSSSTKGSMLAKDSEILEYLETLKNAQPAESEVQVGKGKIKQVVLPAIVTDDDIENAHALNDPLDFLKKVWQDKSQDMKHRVASARAAIPYVHGRIAPTGKKEGKAEEAKKAAQSTGRFGTLGAQTEKDTRPS